ncbi:dihydrofolate reductase [Emydomyces testavorans]|uniref:Dihydrofolate reductase n=1 Tax=Emydomyces testavorans TaxID=2070801 RepID=A0AAF0DHU8_9EURO|nr:dihydrofolate reductase [Emydomyces testavorans]
MAPHCPSPTATKLPPLTLVVATTPITTPTNASISRLGIGHRGTLPWPRIKSDMSFFARITTRPPPAASAPPHQPPQAQSAINAVIMGRKTYDSLPDRFRPLPKRLNVIITRDETGMVRERAVAEWKALREREREAEREKRIDNLTGVSMDESQLFRDGCEREEEPDVLVSNTVEAALTTLRDDFGPFARNGKRALGSILVIGGGEIYASSLKLDTAGFGCKMRIVMTDVRRPATEAERADPASSVNGFECDTFFPIDDLSGDQEWRQAPTAEVSEWVGEQVPSGWVWERDVAIRFLGFERKQPL